MNYKIIIKGVVAYLVVSTVVVPFVLTSAGCATGATGSSTANTQAFLDKHGPVVKACIQAIRQIAVKYAVKDPKQVNVINNQITQVAQQVSNLLNSNNFDPDAVTVALKVDESYVSDALNVLAVAYTAAYNDSDGNQKLARTLLQLIADGLSSQSKAGTQPSPYTVQ